MTVLFQLAGAHRRYYLWKRHTVDLHCDLHVTSTTAEIRLQMPVALSITKLRYVLNFRHPIISSEAYILQK